MLTETEVKDKIRYLAIKMLEKIKNEYNNSGKYWENLGKEKALLEELSTTNLSNVEDEKLAKYLEKLENAFLYTISKLPWKEKNGNYHYPVGENKVTDKFLDKVAAAINDGNADQLNGENFATLLLHKSNENSNIKYAIPQCIKGDITSAKLYHCLLNPGSGISDKDNQYDNFHDYLHDNAAMKDHLRIFDENGHVTKEKLVEYMNDLNKNMLITEFEDFMNDKNCKNGLPMNIIKKYFHGSNEKEKHDENHYYCKYISDYYATLVAKDLTKFREFIECNDLATIKNRIDSVNMCNLELIPLRSQDGATIGNFIDENPFAVNIILRRICIYELSNDNRDSVQPIFIFRTYDKWKKRINEYIKKNFEKEDAKNIIDYLTKNYFLKINQSGTISKNNIKSEIYGVKSNSAYAFVESLNKEGVDFDTIIPEKLELIEENEFTKENANHGKVSIIKVKYAGMDFKLEVAEQNDDKIKNLFFTNNLDKERLINEIKLALRAYKYIDDAQNAFSSGLKTNKPKK